MNEVRLGGWFATEVSFSLDEHGKESASFIIRVQRPACGEDFFRVICIGDAARVVREAAEGHLLVGSPVAVEGRLAQDVLQDEDGQGFKAVRIVARNVTL